MREKLWKQLHARDPNSCPIWSCLRTMYGWIGPGILLVGSLLLFISLSPSPPLFFVPSCPSNWTWEGGWEGNTNSYQLVRNKLLHHMTRALSSVWHQSRAQGWSSWLRATHFSSQKERRHQTSIIMSLTEVIVNVESFKSGMQRDNMGRF